ncbi:hypothetical protein JCM10207_005359 [Rhodosporidiobolus poonsookiae]
MDTVRRIVSGKKARLEEDGFSLDLVKLTDRIIIMGYPADGVASLYRNKRSDVLRFLEPYAPHYKIFNLCPLSENSYDAAEFVHAGVEREGKAVARFPWPDHHPPPLSLMPVMADAAKRWYEGGASPAEKPDEAAAENVVVIHCKAGKGRSGTFAISLLLTLPGIPAAPAIASSTNENWSALDPRAVLPKSGEDIAKMSCSDKLEYLLRFHTLRRMSAKAKTYGVSIASQRRFLGYFARLLEGQDPRVPLWLGQPAPPPRRILLESISITGPGLSGAGKVLSAGSEKMAVQLYRYKDSIAANLRRRELDLANGKFSDDEDWDDRGEMFVHIGGFGEAASSSSPSATSVSSTSSLSPMPTQNPAPDAAASSRLPTANANRSPASTASASTGSLPSQILATPDSSRAPTPSLPPASGTAALAADAASTTPARTPRRRTLAAHTAFVALPANALDGTNPSRRPVAEAKRAAKEEGGVELDADREVQLRFLVGETGKKHAKLPVMASLALSWFIPSFESTPAEPGSRSKIILKAKELDFLKPFAGIEEVEVAWRWLD